jgi:N-acylglucosamine 2-epimerase
MAFGQLYKATGIKKYEDICLNTFNRIIERKGNPKGQYNKVISKTRKLKNFALPMILANLSVEIEDVLDDGMLKQLRSECIDAVMNEFYNNEYGLILENINIDNTFSDTLDGRLLNPGHSLEALWFIMDLAEKENDQKLLKKCGQIALNILEYSWDQKHGGIFYFLDVKGYPTQQLEWDQKLWWVHFESAIMCIKAYAHLGDSIFLEWFQKIHEYQWNHYRDPQFGEWFGYLNREGKPLLQLKGGKWKGCFHVPRSLFIIQQTISRL